MKEFIKTVYKCDHCGKNYLRKHSCVNHEKWCSKNPANYHACFDCKLLEVDRVTSDQGFSEKTFRCTKLDKYLYSFKAEKIQHDALGYAERMPLQCADKDVYYPLEQDF